MKHVKWPLAILLLTLAQLAHADTFNLTQIELMVFAGTGDNVEFELTGPGTHIEGVGGIFCLNAWCRNPTIPPGTSVFPNIGEISIANFNSTVVGGKNYGTEFGFGSPGPTGLTFDVLGSIVLPLNPQGSTFTACVPASVQSPITGSAGSGPTFTQFMLLPPAGGTFCTTWDFEDLPTGAAYEFVRGTFFVSTIPEPGSFGLFGSGLVAILGAVVRKGIATRRRRGHF